MKAGTILAVNQSNLIQLSASDMDTVCSQIAAFGFTAVRFAVNWAQTVNWFGPPTYTKVEAAAAALAKYNLTPLPVLGINKPWLSDGSVATFGKYVTTCVSIFGGIPAYEVWNEPNLYNFSVGTPKTFLAYLRAAAVPIRAAGSKVIHGGLAAYPNAHPWFFFTNYSPDTWLTALFAAGENNDYDLMGYHPYALSQGGNWTNPIGSYGMSEIAKLDAVRATHGDTRPYVFTEIGYDTARVSAAATELPAQLAALPAGDVYFFCWRDTVGDGGSFGVVNSKNVPKLPYYNVVSGLLAG